MRGKFLVFFAGKNKNGFWFFFGHPFRGAEKRFLVFFFTTHSEARESGDLCV